MPQKILIACDESENARRAVDYVARTLSTDHQVTLMAVIQDTASLCEMASPELTPYFKAQQASFCELEDQKKKVMQNALQAARQSLLDAGFPEENVSIKIEEKKKGVARDIAAEAAGGYDLIVVGRRGVAGIREFFLGSTSQKILSLAADKSVLIVN
jgi:nucleotide-binding universal stress UspA family protein